MTEDDFADEEEREPIVRNQKAPGDLRVGDYVFASRWSDCDPGDPWAVGFVTEVWNPEEPGGYGFVKIGGCHQPHRCWPKAMKITPEQGERIVAEYPPLAHKPQDYDAIARIFGVSDERS